MFLLNMLSVEMCIYNGSSLIKIDVRLPMQRSVWVCVLSTILMVRLLECVWWVLTSPGGFRWAQQRVWSMWLKYIFTVYQSVRGFEVINLVKLPVLHFILFTLSVFKRHTGVSVRWETGWHRNLAIVSSLQFNSTICDAFLFVISARIKCVWLISRDI